MSGRGGSTVEVALLGRTPHAGDLLLIDRAASVQFAGVRSLLFRVTRVDERDTCTGWVWLRGYTTNHHGEAVMQRDIFVQVAGLKTLCTQRALRGSDDA